MSDIAFAPPPIPDHLDPEVLAGISDDVLEFVLVSYVYKRIRDPEDDQPMLLGKIPEPLRTWFLTFIVDGDVLNGGFNQLFFNVPTEVLHQAPNALETAGMPKAAQLMRNALVAFVDRAPVIEAAQADGSIDAFMESYDDDPFQALDAEYGAHESEFRAARLAFLHREASRIRHP